MVARLRIGEEVKREGIGRAGRWSFCNIWAMLGGGSKAGFLPNFLTGNPFESSYSDSRGSDSGSSSESVAPHFEAGVFTKEK